MTPRRLPKPVRRGMIVNTGAVIAKRDGLAHVTFESVADACPVDTSPSTVAYHFKTLPDLWRAIIDYDPSLQNQGVALGL